VWKLSYSRCLQNPEIDSELKNLLCKLVLQLTLWFLRERGEMMSELIFYTPKDGGAVQVRLEGETVWLTQKQLAQVFDKNVRTVSEHIGKIFADGELPKNDAVIRNFRITGSDGKQYETAHYNLDMIISVGYRVNSKQGVQFRQWATSVLREHLQRGYTLDKQRFEKNAQELEAALQLIKKTAQSPELSLDAGRGLTEIVARYAQIREDSLLKATKGSKIHASFTHRISAP
jgi:Virulence protein RhuM family